MTRQRRFSLARIMAKLAGTSEVVIMISFMVMNLEKILSGCLIFLLYIWQSLKVSLQECVIGVCNLHLVQKISTRIPQLMNDKVLNTGYSASPA